MMNCSTCGSDQTQRLEVIFHGGTQQIDTKSAGVIGGYLGGFGGAATSSKTTGVQQSLLAQKASPPARKGLPWWAYAIGVVFIGLYGIPTIIVGALWYKNFTWNRDVWPALYDEWMRSWYCHKCGTEFVIN